MSDPIKFEVTKNQAVVISNSNKKTNEAADTLKQLQMAVHQAQAHFNTLMELNRNYVACLALDAGVEQVPATAQHEIAEENGKFFLVLAEPKAAT